MRWQYVPCLLLANLMSFHLVLSPALAEEGASETDTAILESPLTEAEPNELPPPVPPAKRKWSIKIGAGMSAGPGYEGGEDLNISDYPQPLVDLRWRFRNEWDTKVFAGTLGGVGIEIIDTDAFSFGLRGSQGGGRSEDEDDQLEGLGDINGSLNFTLTGKLKFDYFGVGMDVTHFLAGSEGTLVTFGAGTKLPLTQNFELGLGISTTLGDGSYMGEFFSVTQGQARDSVAGLDRFDADAGFKDVTLKLVANYEIVEDLTLSAKGELGWLLGDAADSPVAQRTIQPDLGVGLIYKF